MVENKYPFHAVMDVRIHAVTMEEALRCAREMAASGEEHIIATANAEMVMIAPAVLHALQILMLEIGRHSCAAPCIGIGSGTATLNLYVHSPLLSFSLS